MAKIGFIGTGIMGHPMALNLQKAGHSLFLSAHHDPAPADLVAGGAIALANPKEVAQEAEFIIIMVPDTPQVEDVLFRADGIAAGVGKGKVVIDMSSISPTATKAFAAKINEKGAQYLDAPVSGGEVGAKAASLSIMIGGDADERTHLQELLRGVRRGWESQTYGLTRIILFTTAYNVLASPFPLLVAAPRYIMGLISLGTLMQTAQAFQQVTAALSFPVDNLSTIAQWQASVERVMALQDALDRLQEELGENRIEMKHEGSSLHFAGVRVMEHDAVPLMHELTAEIGPGQHVLIEGETQLCHKLILAVAGLWPWGAGKVTLPAGANIFMASDRPYLPVGALGEAVCYPLTLGVCVPDDINSALRRVGLGDWVGHLAVEGDWERVLSAAQQQRLSFARMLLHRPDWIFLAEATNALDVAAQREMAALLVAELPSAAVVAVGRAEVFDGFFQRVLHVEAETASG